MVKSTALLMFFIYTFIHLTPIEAHSKSNYSKEITELTETECQSVIGGVSSHDMCHAGMVLILTGLAISIIGVTTGVGFSMVYPDKSIGVTFIGLPMAAGAAAIGATFIEFGLIFIGLSPLADCLALPDNSSSGFNYMFIDISFFI